MADLKGRRILVTGGAGFIGSHIIDLLCDEGCVEIVALDNMVRGRPENLRRAMSRGPVRLVHGDIRDGKLMAALVQAADIVFHQAALRITHCAAEPRLAMEVMVDATFDLLELCVKHNVEKVIAASSASVYGMAEEFPTTERQNPYDNRTLYGAAKAFNEGLLRTYNDMHGLDYVAFRYFNVYGDRMDIHGRYTEVLIRWMERLEAGPASDHLRRWPADHGFRACSRCCSRQYYGSEGKAHRRGVQCCERNRNQPVAACDRPWLR